MRLAGWDCWYVPAALAHHARTTRGLGSTPYLSAIGAFHRHERQKPHSVQTNAMKNQWLMLIKNEDGFNFVRDLPFIFAREAVIIVHHALFAPKTLVAVPMTLRLLPETLRKRRAAKQRQAMDPRTLRQWIGAARSNADKRSRIGWNQ